MNSCFFNNCFLVPKANIFKPNSIPIKSKKLSKTFMEPNVILLF